MAVTRKKNTSRLLLYIAVFLLFFIAACRYRNLPWFGTDELDIMVGGKGIASGYRLYNDFISQHMPVSYYISAFFELLGFKDCTFAADLFLCLLCILLDDHTHPVPFQSRNPGTGHVSPCVHLSDIDL